jgi:hypothetical protein
VPPQDIAGTDGNQGERDPVGIANEVEGRKELVGGNTDGGKVVADGGKNRARLLEWSHGEWIHRLLERRRWRLKKLSVYQVRSAIHHNCPNKNHR